jgi:hypothetical protein
MLLDLMEKRSSADAAWRKHRAGKDSRKEGAQNPHGQNNSAPPRSAKYPGLHDFLSPSASVDHRAR